jgi:hypothetical protein
MTKTRGDIELERTSARDRLIVGIGIALLVAGLSLVVAVLPAEFGVDPTGLGARLGLTPLADLKRDVASFEQGNAPTSAAQTVVHAERRLQQETIELMLGPREFVEYKYRLDKGQALLYEWHSTADVNVEFHAEPDAAPKGYAETYEKQSAVAAGSGTLTAPFGGIHGWYWENTTDAPVTVTLSSAGFYNLAHEFRKDAAPTAKTFR